MTTHQTPEQALANLKLLLAQFPQRKYLSFDSPEDRKFISEVLVALRFAAPLIMEPPRTETYTRVSLRTSPEYDEAIKAAAAFTGVDRLKERLKEIVSSEDAFVGEQPVKIEDDGSVTPLVTHPVATAEDIKASLAATVTVSHTPEKRLHWKTRQKLERKKAMETNLSPND